MNVLLYSAQVSNGDGMQLSLKFEQCVSGIQLIKCDTVDTFTRMIRSPSERYGIAILWISSRNELDTFVTMKDYLDDLPLVLILPEQAKDTLGEAYKLYPRFIGYHDGNLDITAAVVNKMLRCL
jgi:hypothetical protein